MPEDRGLDEEVGAAMDLTYFLVALHPDNTDTADQLRMRITAYNLRALATTLLMADDDPETFSVNLKQVVLGLLGTADWLTRTLPPVAPTFVPEGFGDEQ